MPPRPARSTRDSDMAVDVPVRPHHGDRGGQKDDKRKQILRAAVKVFAEKGYHGCRISDVAEEAGVAYGLVYHYFGNKDGLLSSVFDTNWAFFSKAVEDIAGAPSLSMYAKLKQVVELAFQAFEIAPLTVKVLVLEFGRNARIGEALENPAVTRVFAAIARIFEDGRKNGELAEGVDPYAMSVLFMGALETAFVSFVLTNSGTRSNIQNNITIDTMKSTLLAIVQRAVVGHAASSTIPSVAKKEK